MDIKEGGVMDIQKEIDVFLSKQPKEIARIFSLIEFCESLNVFRFKKYNTKLDLGVDLHILNYGWSMWQAKAKAQAVPEGYILIPKKMPDEVNDHLWDFMTDNFVCTNDYGDSFMACDDFNLDKFYAELVKAQGPANE